MYGTLLFAAPGNVDFGYLAHILPSLLACIITPTTILASQYIMGRAAWKWGGSPSLTRKILYYGMKSYGTSNLGNMNLNGKTSTCAYNNVSYEIFPSLHMEMKIRHFLTVLFSKYTYCASFGFKDNFIWTKYFIFDL